MEEVDEIVQEFLVESYDSLDKLDSDFVALEENPGDRERLANIFRTVHTVKGTSGFLDFPKLERIAHVGENLMVPLRDGELQLNNEIVDSLLGMVDAIRQILGNVETTGGEGENDYADLISKLEHAKLQSATDVADEDIKVAEDSVAAEHPDTEAEAPKGISKALDDRENEPSAEKPAKQIPTANDSSDVNSPSNKSDHNEEIATDPDSAKSSKKEAASSKSNEVVASAKPAKSLSDSTVRINVDLLDQLMNLVGELVLTRNQILQHSQDSSDNAVTTASQRLNHITTELQEGVMKTRMQPIRSAWSKLPRVVRDLSMSCGKQVKVEMEGADTELDKTILEAIKDPLTHIVRNSVDHGIESPEARKAAGKPTAGTLLLRAFHEGGQVNIEITDDGAGINMLRVRDKAIEKGLITTEKADSMSERELINLVLLPGFSTAEKVTNVSGRGVGMDVVRTNIEQIGGSLDLQSKRGQGTTLRIKIPLTLAIVPALIVGSAQQPFAIPQVSLLELVRLEGERAEREIEMLHNVPVFRLRGKLLPLLYLNDELELTANSASCVAPNEEDSQGHRRDDEHAETACVNIVVLQAEDRQFGLVVDAINDTQEIVVKPLGKHLSSVQTFAGATIMGDGSVALILDVVGLAKAGGMLEKHQVSELHESHQNNGTESATTRSMLIVDRGDGIRVAIELSSVARLETFNLRSLEQTDIGAVVQYRGGILPLVSMIPKFSLDRSVQADDQGDDANEQIVQAVVFNGETGSVGVIVSKIVDVVEHSLESIGTSDEWKDSQDDLHVIQDRVTKVVDLAGTLQTLPPIQTKLADLSC